MVLLLSGLCLAIWPLHIHIQVRIVQQYLRKFLIEFFRFQKVLSRTGHAVPIFLVAQDYIAEVLDNTGLKIQSFYSPSLIVSESVFHIIIRPV